MNKNTQKKYTQLKMPQGTAANRLRKTLMFHLIQKLGENYCFQCGAEILHADDMTIEHKIPWLDSEDPVDLFFNLNNIAFSHFKCNIGAARQPNKLTGLDDPRFNHNEEGYKKGCRCEICKSAKRKRNSKRYKRRGG